MLKKRVILLLLSTSFLAAACGNNNEDSSTNEEEADASGNETITISAQTMGSETTRVDNLVNAADELNEELKSEGTKKRVKVETDVFDGSWEEYRNQFLLGYQSGNEPDIYTIGHEEVAWLADGDYILPMNELKDSEAYAGVSDRLWDSATWQGDIWGAIQDVEARPIFYREDILSDMGWSDEEINSLPDRIEKGQFTLDDMTATAEEAVEQGVADWGIIHRPVNGPDFHMITKNFGADLYNEEQDQLVFDKNAILETLQYHEELTQTAEVTPESMTSMEWENVHQTMLDGNALFYYGGIWNVFNYMETGASYEEIMNNFGFSLVPAAEKGGKPMTLSHPLLYTVSSNTDHPDLVKRLLKKVAAPKYQAKHAVETYHIPFSEKGQQVEEYQNHEFLSSVSYMLDYTTFLPNNEDFTTYSDAYFNAMQAVELGDKSPEEALKDMETQINSEMQDNIIIEE